MEGKAIFKVVVFNNNKFREQATGEQTDRDVMSIRETFKNRSMLRSILHYFHDLTSEEIMGKLEEGKK